MISVKVIKNILNVIDVSDTEGTISFVTKDEDGNKIPYDIESISYNTDDKGEICSITLNLEEA